MNKSKKMPALFKTSTLAMSLLLGVGTADAATFLEVDPGTPGEAAHDIHFGSFGLDDDGLLRVTFTDNKTLEWDAGSHFWLSPGQPPNTSYIGFFLDSNLDAIPTAAFAGQTTGVGADLSPPIAFAALEEDGVYSGLLFVFSGQGLGVGAVELTWEWGSDAPLVGVIPIPAAVWLFGSALLGLAGVSISRSRSA